MHLKAEDYADDRIRGMFSYKVFTISANFTLTWQISHAKKCHPHIIATCGASGHDRGPLQFLADRRPLLQHLALLIQPACA